MNPVLDRGKNADDLARDRIRHSLGESLIVEASAGTGKTTELIARLVEVLGEGLTTVDRVVAVTFTHKAAGELKIRLRGQLDEARAVAAPDRRLRLETALEQLEEAAIGTIHGFCAQILRARPVEAEVDPAFEELAEGESQRIFERAFDLWFERSLQRDSPGLRRALARLAWRDAREDGPALDQLKYAAKTVLAWRDFQAPWHLSSYPREDAIRELLEETRALGEALDQASRKDDDLRESLRPVSNFLVWLDRGNAPDADTLEAVLLKLGRDLGSHRFRKGRGPFANGVTRESVVARYEDLRKHIEAFRMETGQQLAAQLQREMASLVEIYTDLKRSVGKLDFVDLLDRTAKLLRTNLEVRTYFQQRYSHIFVDEFQDTDPLQAEILLLLSSSDPQESGWLQVRPVPGKLFLVGDPKQSIYKFRRADVTLYRALGQALERCGVQRVYLYRSHRSVRDLQRFTNAAFQPAFEAGKDTAQAQYSPLLEDGPEREGQPSVVVLPVPRPYGKRDVTKTAIDACLPETVCEYVRWLVDDSGWTVREAGELRSIAPRHICLLFRRFINFGKDLTRPYAKGLETRGIPHLLAGSRSFHHREEVDTIRAALSAIEWPGDELSVFATLRGSLFGIKDFLLFRFRLETGGGLHPFRPLPPALDPALKPVADALRVLARLHRTRNRRPIAATINDLLDSVRAHAGFSLRPGGSQVLANVLRLCDLARTFEATGGLSFRGFVDELTQQAERVETPEAPILEEASEGVRIMTVHNAKGLEFPVVILCDITANIASREPERHVDASRSLCATRLLRCAPRELLENEAVEREREVAEGVRVCYVAATRARDLLVVPAVGDGPRESWLEPLNLALFPALDSYRLPEACDYLPFRGDVSVLERPFPVRPHEEGSVKPGLHRAARGDHRIAWWDPAVLRNSPAESFGVRHRHLLEQGPASETALEGYREWLQQKSAVRVRAKAPSVDVRLVTSFDADPPGSYPVEVQSVSNAGRYRGGKRFGILMHGVLRDLPFQPEGSGPQDIRTLVALHASVTGATSHEEAAACAAVAKVIEHPIWVAARSAERVHRELPVVVSLPNFVSLPNVGVSSGHPDAPVLEGVLDLAYRMDGGWVVVDYKTDMDLDENIDAYKRQLRWYLHALERLTGDDVRGVLLRI